MKDFFVKIRPARPPQVFLQPHLQPIEPLVEPCWSLKLHQIQVCQRHLLPHLTTLATLRQLKRLPPVPQILILSSWHSSNPDFSRLVSQLIQILSHNEDLINFNVAIVE